jgi:hypothetical protein
MKERAPRAGRAGGVQIGVVQHDQRVVAAQLQGDPLERPTGGRTNLAAHGRRAGEGDHRDLRVEGECLTGFGVAGQDVEESRGQPGCFKQGGDERAAGDRGLHVGLQDDRVAERQCGHDGVRPPGRGSGPPPSRRS